MAKKSKGSKIKKTGKRKVEKWIRKEAKRKLNLMKSKAKEVEMKTKRSKGCKKKTGKRKVEKRIRKQCEKLKQKN